ncbi:MAG: signal peptide peptidase SppA [Candidatus ainarchaeum sp.]|nr:signal peptide peptidase SppA [Candidatus ainarchaeum sp.]
MAEERRAGNRRPGEGKERNYGLYAAIVFLSLGLVFLMVFGLFSLASGAANPFGKCVAVVEINGEITTTDTAPSLFSEGMSGSYEISKRIEAVGRRDDVGAVLFVINSPGGSIVASDEIYRAVDGLEKPRVAYFREVAASGAYYIATPVDYIISEPNALTGSIGVIMTTYDASGLFEKIGVGENNIQSGAMKDVGTPFRNLTEGEKAVLDGIVQQAFQQFNSTVIENRGARLDRAKYDEILDARVITGRTALDVGLVDAVGSRDDAIRKAAELGGIEYGGDLPPVCEIDVSGVQPGLLSVSGLLRELTARESGYSLEYR